MFLDGLIMFNIYQDSQIKYSNTTYLQLSLMKVTLNHLARVNLRNQQKLKLLKKRKLEEKRRLRLQLKRNHNKIKTTMNHLQAHKQQQMRRLKKHLNKKKNQSNSNNNNKTRSSQQRRQQKKLFQILSKWTSELVRLLKYAKIQIPRSYIMRKLILVMVKSEVLPQVCKNSLKSRTCKMLSVQFYAI